MEQDAEQSEEQDRQQSEDNAEDQSLTIGEMQSEVRKNQMKRPNAQVEVSLPASGSVHYTKKQLSKMSNSKK